MPINVLRSRFRFDGDFSDDVTANSESVVNWDQIQSPTPFIGSDVKDQAAIVSPLQYGCVRAAAERGGGSHRIRSDAAASPANLLSHAQN